MTLSHRMDIALGGLGRPVAAFTALCAVTLPLAAWMLRSPEKLGMGLMAYVLLVAGVLAAIAAVTLSVGGWLSCSPRRRAAAPPSET